MEVKKITEGMTAPQVAQVIEDNFKVVDKKKADKTELQAEVKRAKEELENNISANRYGYNVTVNGLKGGVHTIVTAVNDVPSKFRMLGQKITFRTENGDWATYHNESLSLDNYTNVNDWVQEVGVSSVQGDVNIINAPDYEDLTEAKDGTIKFSDKEFNKESFSGLGRIYLRKNIIEGLNVFTQDMISKPNTIYIIQYDYDLKGVEIIIPEGCVLDFQGGSLNNGKVIFTNTLLTNNVKLFGIDVRGELENNFFQIEWFGAKADGITDCTNAFDVVNNYIYNKYIDEGKTTTPFTRKILLNPGTYIVSSFKLQSGLQIIGAGLWSTTIKTKTENEYGVVNIVHNDALLDSLTIDGGSEEGLYNIGLYAYGNNGQNTKISKVRFINCSKHSAVIEDTNMVCIDRCKFEDGQEGFLLLDGADDVFVSYCVFETYKDFACPYAIKVQTEKTVNKTANNANILGNWFETHYENTFDVSIFANAYNVNIHDNHFHTIPSAQKSYVCYIGDNTDMIKFCDNNIQNTGTRGDGKREYVLGISENAGFVYAANNRGLYNFDNSDIQGSKFKIIYADGREYKSNYTNYTNGSPYNINTINSINDQWKAPLILNRLRLWYDANYVVRCKFSDPTNNYDGDPIGTYVKNGGSDSYPSLTNTQRGYVYSENGLLRCWNGSEFIAAETGCSKDLKSYGLFSDRPELSKVKNGYKYISDDKNTEAVMFASSKGWINADGFNADYGRKGYSGARPNCTSDDIGYQYFDRSLNKPIWWDGSAWVDATGNVV